MQILYKYKWLNEDKPNGLRQFKTKLWYDKTLILLCKIVTSSWMKLDLSLPLNCE